MRTKMCFDDDKNEGKLGGDTMASDGGLVDGTRSDEEKENESKKTANGNRRAGGKVEQTTSKRTKFQVADKNVDWRLATGLTKLDEEPVVVTDVGSKKEAKTRSVEEAVATAGRRNEMLQSPPVIDLCFSDDITSGDRLVFLGR